jgi:hypothetical protein
MASDDLDLSETASESGGAMSTDEDALFKRLRREFRKDAEHWQKWRELARDDFRLYAGHQWSDDDQKILKEQGRPAVSMNRILTTIRVVSGYEVGNRQEIKYIPRTAGDVKINELVTSACKWFRDSARSERAESDAFNDSLICGVGCLETRIEHENNPDGDPDERRIDPLEMLVDRYSTEPGFRDAKRVWRIRTLPRSDAEEMFPEADPADLHAGWAESQFDDETVHNADPPAYEDRSDDKEGTRDEVTIVECQWSRREAFMRVATAGGEQQITLAEWAQLQKRMRAEGVDPGMFQAVKQFKLKRYRTFLGKTVLENGPTPCPSHFSYQFITGMRDQSNGTWFGLVRPMSDPQRWMNKFFSQILHIINSSAKGGIMAKPGAFEDQRQAEESWAKQDAITWLSQQYREGDIQEKPQAQVPAGIFQLMQFAFDFVPRASGVNEELVGMRDANQPGVLEAQRKQSGMTILAGFFDSLTDARKSIGEIILYILQNDLPDGRIIRIVGEEKEMNVPLLREKTAGDYDIIVSEAPTTPNEKERNWAIIGPMLQSGMLPQSAQLAALEYSPLPETFVQQIKDAAEQEAQQPPPPDPAVQKAEAEIQIAQQKHQAAIQQKQVEFEANTALEQQRLLLERQKMEAELETARMRAAAEIQIAREKAQADIETERMKAAMKAENDARTAEMNAFRRDATQTEVFT